MSKENLCNLLAPISIGELLDKITILDIKKGHMTGEKLNNVIKERTALEKIIKDNNFKIDVNLFYQLKEVNLNLWNIEDNIRLKEDRKEFDQEFILLARSVYKENDKRASIKRKINCKYNSNLIEEKSYTNYQS